MRVKCRGGANVGNAERGADDGIRRADIRGILKLPEVKPLI